MADSFGPVLSGREHGESVPEGSDSDSGTFRKEPIRVLVVDDHALSGAVWRSFSSTKRTSRSSERPATGPRPSKRRPICCRTSS